VIEAMRPDERAAWEQRFATHGRLVLAALREGRMTPEQVSSYVVEYHRAHLERAGAGLEVLLELVSPAWRSAWALQKHAFNGLLSDVRRVRRHATAVAQGASDQAARRPALRAIARCALVEASMFTLANLTQKARGEEDWLPFGHDVLDFGIVIDDGPTRSAVLHAIAAMLPDARRETVLGWAREASAEPGPPMPVLPPSYWTPEQILEAARAQLEEGRLAYTSSVIHCIDIMDDADVALFLYALLDCMLEGSHHYRRFDFLQCWDGSDFLHLVPFFARLGGEDAVFAVAEELRDIATWFP
jgi:hypothetical protein